MKLIAHLVASDVRRHRGLLVMWLLVIVASAVMEGLTPSLTTSGEVRLVVQLLGTLLSLAWLLLAILIVPAIVQSDPPLGSDTFWLTRPIAPRTILAAKTAILVLAVVVVPAAIDMALMGVYRVPFKYIAAVVVDESLKRLFVLAVLAVPSVLTLGLPRFVVLLASAMTTLVFVLGLIAAVMAARADDGPPTLGSVDPEDPTKGIVWLALAILAVCAAIATQYQRRQRRGTIAVAAAGLVLASGVSWAWPWPVLSNRLLVPSWAAERPSPFRIFADPATVETSSRVERLTRDGRWRQVRARLHLGGMEPGWTAQVALRGATLQLKGGRTLASAAGPHNLPSLEGSESRATRQVLAELLGVSTLVDLSPTRGESAVVMTMRDEEFSRVAPAEGAYEGQFVVIPTRYAIETRLPLVAGAKHRSDRYQLSIEGVERAPGGVVLRVRETRIATMFNRRFPPQVHYFLRNLRESGALEGSADERRHSMVAGMLPFHVSGGGESSGFKVRGLFVEFPPRYSASRDLFPIDDPWIDHAELIVVGEWREHSFERTLFIPGFQLPLPTPASAVNE